MTMVLAVGTSMPVSMMVEHSSRLKRCATKSRITRSSSRSGIWPWATAMRASGSSFFELLAPVLDGLDLVVQEVDLPAALQLAQHRLADHAVALVAHEGLDGQAALRRGGDHAQVAQALQRHAQVRGMGVAVSVSTSTSARSAFICLLVAHAEAVLLVDDQQAQVLELGGFSLSSLCVPTTMSTLPSARPLSAAVISLPERKRLISATLTGHLPKRSTSVW
jgi:hypothetical protein